MKKKIIVKVVDMPYLREVREALLLSHFHNIIDDDEFVCLYELNTSNNLDLPYWQYERFNLENITDDECWSEFRFNRGDLYILKDALHIPDEVVTYNRLKVDGVESLCILLKRFTYPCRYSDLIPRFGRSVPQIAIITNHITDLIYSNFNQPWLFPANLETFCQAIHRKGAALDHCWGFVDGTVRPICRPNAMQRVLYNGHKKVHSIKFQSVAAPNGLITSFTDTPC